MPDDIYDILSRPDKAKEEENWFFPGGGWNILGALDLILGAPARGIQGGITGILRGENPVKTSVGSALGFSLDKGEFGQGEMASGRELLEEIGILGKESKEELGGIVAGIGVDVATDLLAFNLAGAAKNAITKPGKLKQANMIGRDVRYRRSGDFLPLGQQESRVAKRAIIERMSLGQASAFDNELRRIGVNVRNGLIRDIRRQEMRKGYLSRHLKGKWIDTLKEKYGSVEEATERLIDSFEFDDTLSIVVDKQAMMKRLFRGTTVNLGRASGTPGVKTLHEIIDLDLPFEVRFKGIAKAKPEAPPSWFDLTFPDNPRFLRDALPASETGEIVLNLTTRTKPKGFWGYVDRVMTKAMPAQLSPFDWGAVLRRVGIMSRVLEGHNKKIKHLLKHRELRDGIVKKFGLRLGDEEQAVRIGKAMDGIVSPGLTDKEMEAADELRKLFDFSADLIYEDVRQGVKRKVIPEEFRLEGYFPHMSRNKTVREKLLEGLKIADDDGEGASIVISMADDLPGAMFNPHELRRADAIEDIEYNAWKVLDSYAVTSARKAFLEPEVLRVLPTIKNLNRAGEKGLYKASLAAINSFTGNYGHIDSYLDDLLKSVTGKTFSHSATRTSLAITGVTYEAMLGLNPRTMGLQLIQGILNNSVHLGIWPTLKGLFRVGSDGYGNAKTLLRQSSLLDETYGLIHEGIRTELGVTASKARKIFDKTMMGGLNAFDNFNRGWAFHAALGEAKKAGLSMESALHYAARAANETQFIYGKLGSSPGRNNPLGRVLLQFMSFTTKQLSFMAQNARRDPATSFMRYLAISGMIARTIGKEIDVSSELTPTTPGDVANLVTMKRIPSLQWGDALLDMGDALLEESLGISIRSRSIDPEFAKEQLAKVVVGTILPGGTMVNRAMKYAPTLGALPPETEYGVGGFNLVTGAKGQELDKYGRTIRDITPSEAVSGVVGFRSMEANREYAARAEMRFRAGLLSRRYERLLQHALRAYKRGKDPNPFLTEAQRLTLKTRVAIIREFRTKLQNRQTSMLEREKKRLPKRIKRDMGIR